MLTKEPIVDREFAERFMWAVDRPFDYGVYFLFHDFWATAPQSAIDEYLAHLHSVPGAEAFLAERHLPEPIGLDELDRCAPGTLGAGYKSFILDNELEANLARNYWDFNALLSEAGTLDRLPDDISYTIVRGFQLHDMMHVITGFSSAPLGELAQAGFHFGQLQFPYHAFRFATTTAHIAFVQPKAIGEAMDALCAGWMLGRATPNLHFRKLEADLHTPLEDIRAELGIDTSAFASF